MVDLLENAVRFSPGGGQVRVELALAPACEDIAGPCAHVTVSDQGIGIPPSEQGAIFEPFVRGSNISERNYPGLGVGLAISKEVIEQHGGRIWVESAGQGQGSTFHLMLPVAPSASPPAPAASP